jgi:hypothetical protein
MPAAINVSINEKPSSTGARLNDMTATSAIARPIDGRLRLSRLLMFLTG